MKAHTWRGTPAHTRYAIDRSLLIKLVDVAVESINKSKIDYDSIAVCGISGITFGTLLAFALDKDLVIVRKKEICHSYNQVEGPDEIEKYIFVDDTIDSGRTIKGCMKGIEERWNFSNCVGIYMYMPNFQTYYMNDDQEYLKPLVIPRVKDVYYF